MSEPEPTRNYLIEAMKIITGESRFTITEKAHLMAVAEDAAIARQRVIQMGMILAALLVNDDAGDDTAIVIVQTNDGRPGILIPAELIDRTTRMRVSVTIEMKPEGIVVAKLVPDLQAEQQKVSVN